MGHLRRARLLGAGTVAAAAVAATLLVLLSGGSGHADNLPSITNATASCSAPTVVHNGHQLTCVGGGGAAPNSNPSIDHGQPSGGPPSP